MECELAFSSTNATLGSLSASFAANRGTDHTLVFNRRMLAFPATAPTGAKPNPFLAPVWFDRPFFFDKGKAPAGLLWEARVFSTSGSPGTAFALDCQGAAITRTPPRGVSAPGCPALPGGKPLDLAAGFGATTPITLTITLKEAPPQAPVALFLGLRADRFSGLPLPFDLGVFGLAGCNLYVDLLISLAGGTDPQGVLTLALQIPTGVPVPVAMPFYAQAFTTAPGVNPAGLAASNGACAITVSSARTGRVVDQTSSDATMGTVEANRGTVVAIWRN